MVKTGRLEKGKSPDELTGKTATKIQGGRAVDGAVKTAATYRQLPRDIKVTEA